MFDPQDTSPYPIEPIDIVLGRLDKVRRRGLDRWTARCPAHEDRTPSLSIAATREGVVLLHCFAGCEVSDILARTSLSLAELYPDKHGYYRPASVSGRVTFPRHDELAGEMEDYVASAWESAHGDEWRTVFDEQAKRLEGMLNLRRRYGHKF